MAKWRASTRPLAATPRSPARAQGWPGRTTRQCFIFRGRGSSARPSMKQESGRPCLMPRDRLNTPKMAFLSRARIWTSEC
eukprot:176358-Pyramimonas_sp.AAC.1